MSLLLETVWGDLVIDLDIDGSSELCKNVIKLATCRYYTNTLLFSVIPNRIVRCGDPTATGQGGSCIYGVLDSTAKNETESPKRFLKINCGRILTNAEKREKGRVVAMCINGIQDTIGSQFAITLGQGGQPDQALDGYIDGGAASTFSGTIDSACYLSLGRVVEDENNILDKLNTMYIDNNGRPYADIRIIRMFVIHDPFEQDVPEGMNEYMQKHGIIVAEEEQVDDNAAADNHTTRRRRVVDSPSPERPENEDVPKRISIVQVEKELLLDDDDDDIDDEEKQAKIRKRLYEEHEILEKKQSHSRAVVLEMLGDLPSADIRVPENTLFICKLNPITKADDLELIFSRFDDQVKIDIIHDTETGQSLQYGFAEFTSKQNAEEAYLKMNNTLIDDRRIKVDFSQSVSKLWNKYQQKFRQNKMPRLENMNTDRGHHPKKQQRRSNTGNQHQQQQQQRRNRPPPPPSSFVRHDDHSARQQQQQQRRIINNDHHHHQRRNGGAATGDDNRRRQHDDDDQHHHRRRRRDDHSGEKERQSSHHENRRRNGGGGQDDDSNINYEERNNNRQRRHRLQDSVGEGDGIHHRRSASSRRKRSYEDNNVDDDHQRRRSRSDDSNSGDLERQRQRQHRKHNKKKDDDHGQRKRQHHQHDHRSRRREDDDARRNGDGSSNGDESRRRDRRKRRYDDDRHGDDDRYVDDHDDRSSSSRRHRQHDDDEDRRSDDHHHHRRSRKSSSSKHDRKQHKKRRHDDHHERKRHRRSHS